MKLIPTQWLMALAAFGAWVRNDAVTIETLQARLAELNQAANDIQNAADADERALTAEESEKIDSILAEYKTTEKDIERRQQILENKTRLEASAGRKTQPNDVVAAAKPDAEPRQPGGLAYRQPKDPIDNGRHGFVNFGEFAKAVIAGSRRTNPELDPRLMNAPTTYGNEGVGADGGFAVPPDFRSEIQELVMGEDSLLGRTDMLTSSSNVLTIPKDETTAWQTSGGIQAYWEDEAGQLTQSKPALKNNTVRLNKLTSLVPITEELMDDASALDSYLRRKVPQKIDFKVNDAIVNGTGAGMPLGILNADCTVSQAKESGQTAATIVYENIVNMWMRMYAPSRANAVWLINQDIEAQLNSMAFASTAAAGPAYMPPGGLSAAPYGTLMGRPVIATQACQTLGTVGDIILADLTSYLSAVKTQALRTDVSMHLWFDYDTLAYRFIMRVAGQPWLSAAISPKNGTSTVSPFVTLATRA